MSGEDSLPGKRQETSAGILRVRMSHSISRRVTEEPCHEPRSGPEPASSSSTRAPLNELDIRAPERSPEERLAAEGSLELQGPVGALRENNGEGTREPSPKHENGADESRKEQGKTAREDSPATESEPRSAEKSRTARRNLRRRRLWLASGGGTARKRAGERKKENGGER
jgi:hypothetical protein